MSDTDTMPEEIWAWQKSYSYRYWNIIKQRTDAEPYLLKSTVDAERAADSKTIKELAATLEKVCADFKVCEDHVYRKALSDNAPRIAEAQEGKI